jgi:ParB-like chromosome segregation protein Spo0J
MRLNDLAHGKLEAPKLDPREIIIRAGFNYRDTTSEAATAHIEWLAQSIKDRGVDQPISVEFTDGKVFLIDGECRLLALRKLWDAGDEVFVPAISFRGDEAAVLAKAMVAGGSLPPTQLEFGRAAERLINYGWTVERIAALTPPHLGLKGRKAKRFVNDAVELQQAPLAVKDAVAHGVDGVGVSTPLALSATRKNRIMAEEIIKDAVSDAKSKGKSVARRPKDNAKAVSILLAECKQQGDVMVFEIRCETIAAIRAAL